MSYNSWNIADEAELLDAFWCVVGLDALGDNFRTIAMHAMHGAAQALARTEEDWTYRGQCLQTMIGIAERFPAEDEIREQPAWVAEAHAQLEAAERLLRDDLAGDKCFDAALTFIDDCTASLCSHWWGSLECDLTPEMRVALLRAFEAPIKRMVQIEQGQEPLSQTRPATLIA